MARFDRWPCERRPLLDPITGARIEQLTGYPAHHWHQHRPDEHHDQLKRVQWIRWNHRRERDRAGHRDA